MAPQSTLWQALTMVQVSAPPWEEAAAGEVADGGREGSAEDGAESDARPAGEAEHDVAGARWWVHRPARQGLSP
jgi:hypothetical protein